MAYSLQDSYEDIPYSQAETCGIGLPSLSIQNTAECVPNSANSSSPPSPPLPPPFISKKEESRGSRWPSCFPCRSMRSNSSFKACPVADSSNSSSSANIDKARRREKSKSVGSRNSLFKSFGIRDYVLNNKRSIQKRPQESHVDHSAYSDDNSNYPEIEISATVSSPLNEARALPPLPQGNNESMPVSNQSLVGTTSAIVPNRTAASTNEIVNSRSLNGPTTAPNSAVHSQVEYQHHNIYCLSDIYSMSCYWGVIDRYEAEAILENKAEGCFLLRDSAQDDFVFSVSFRRFNRTLHARLEQQDHRFTFDSHDPNIFSANSVSSLLEHYKDPGNCMIYEPMCCTPVYRNNVFSLQDLCRGVIVSNTSYDSISELPMPKHFHQYLRYYHYKTPVRRTNFQ